MMGSRLRQTPYPETPPNFGLQLSIAGAAQSVLRPPCLLSALASEASVLRKWCALPLVKSVSRVAARSGMSS